MNKITISGRIANDLVMRYTQNQKGYVAFNVAVPRKMTDKTDFINVIAWDKKAEYLTNYTVKGKRILVNGNSNNTEYTADDTEPIDWENTDFNIEVDNGIDF